MRPTHQRHIRCLTNAVRCIISIERYLRVFVLITSLLFFIHYERRLVYLNKYYMLWYTYVHFTIVLRCISTCFDSEDILYVHMYVSEWRRGTYYMLCISLSPWNTSCVIESGSNSVFQTDAENNFRHSRLPSLGVQECCYHRSNNL